MHVHVYIVLSKVAHKYTRAYVPVYKYATNMSIRRRKNSTSKLACVSLCMCICIFLLFRFLLSHAVILLYIFIHIYVLVYVPPLVIQFIVIVCNFYQKFVTHTYYPVTLNIIFLIFSSSVRISSLLLTYFLSLYMHMYLYKKCASYCLRNRIADFIRILMPARCR